MIRLHINQRAQVACNFNCLIETEGLLKLITMSLSLRQVQPHSGTSSSISDSPIPSPITSSFDSPLRTSITPSLFHSRLKTYLSQILPPRSFTSFSRTASTDYCLDRFFRATWFSFFLFFVIVSCARLRWLSRQLLSAH